MEGMVFDNVQVEVALIAAGLQKQEIPYSGADPS
jgi:hypothetical protein